MVCMCVAELLQIDDVHTYVLMYVLHVCMH